MTKKQVRIALAVGLCLAYGMAVGNEIGHYLVPETKVADIIFIKLDTSRPTRPRPPEEPQILCRDWSTGAMTTKRCKGTI